MKRFLYILLPVLFMPAFLPLYGQDTLAHTGTIRVKKKPVKPMMRPMVVRDSAYFAAIGMIGQQGRNNWMQPFTRIDSFYLSYIRQGAQCISLPGPKNERQPGKDTCKINYDYRSFFNRNMDFAFPGSLCPRKDTIALLLTISQSGRIREMSAGFSTHTELMLACLDVIRKNNSWQPATIWCRREASRLQGEDTECQLSLILYFDTEK